MNHSLPPTTLAELSRHIKQWAQQLGFADCGICDIDLSANESDYFNWINLGYHGEMQYMVQHGTKRTRPAELISGTRRVISLRMNYFEQQAQDAIAQLKSPHHAYISRYALGRDYHKLIRQRLKQLCQRIAEHYPQAAQRIFVDSAPVLERPLAQKAGLGFIGKNSLLIHPRAGSWFFLAEIYTDLALPLDPPFEKQGCGPCRACLVECPTQAIVADGQVDARRCISYLTIEHPGTIPIELRTLMGNRIYGCDDCQLVCPWNRFSQPNQEPDFTPRHELDSAHLLDLYAWSECQFNRRFEGSPIRRIGYQRWQRNLAVALGNAPNDSQIQHALKQQLGKISPLVDEHLQWALAQQAQKRPAPNLELKPLHAAKYYRPRLSKPTTAAIHCDAT